ncbi:MAG: GntP family permease [Gemmatimonadetes bacterium]|nr:GntP family permease [Gemmatimonadota bacterium]
MPEIHPIAILIVGMITVVGMIVVLRLNAFLALISAALIVSLLSPGETATKISRVAEAFGSTAGSIGIVIALAAIVGKAMLDSGAADRVVRMFLAWLGVERGPAALMASGFVLSVPVFFDTVFFLLLPLARSMYQRTGRHYLKYLMVVSAGAAITHTLVPPTPGPLVIAETLGVDLGLMMLVGLLVALPSAVVGFLFSGWLDRRMPVPLRTEASGVPETEPVEDRQLPGLLPSLLPILLPVLLISANTIVSTLARGEGDAPGAWSMAAPYASLVGNANLALLLSAAIALWVYYAQRKPTRTELARSVEEALMSAGVIILITAAGGAFGAMLRAAEIGPAIGGLFPARAGAPGMILLALAFGVASLLKIAQGSSTVAMITASGMIAAMVADPGTLRFHPVYLATAIASGSLVGSWMNDSGFWIYTKMGGLTEVEALRSWTPLLALLGLAGMGTTVILALVMPLV